MYSINPLFSIVISTTTTTITIIAITINTITITTSTITTISITSIGILLFDYSSLKSCNTPLLPSLLHRYQLDLSEATLTPTNEVQSTATSLLLAKPDFQTGESENSTATSLLPAKPDCQR
jgi:hypothetical protein